jgi:hypothetical protein
MIFGFRKIDRRYTNKSAKQQFAWFYPGMLFKSSRKM